MVRRKHLVSLTSSLKYSPPRRHFGFSASYCMDFAPFQISWVSSEKLVKNVSVANLSHSPVLSSAVLRLPIDGWTYNLSSVNQLKSFLRFLAGFAVFHNTVWLFYWDHSYWSYLKSCQGISGLHKQQWRSYIKMSLVLRMHKNLYVPARGWEETTIEPDIADTIEIIDSWYLPWSYRMGLEFYHSGTDGVRGHYMTLYRESGGDDRLRENLHIDNDQYYMYVDTAFILLHCLQVGLPHAFAASAVHIICTISKLANSVQLLNLIARTWRKSLPRTTFHTGIMLQNPRSGSFIKGL